MESNVRSAAWYLPNHIAAWQESGGVGVSAITELLILNHPEAVAKSESVDFELLSSLFAEDEQKPQSVMMDVMAAISSSSSSVHNATIGGEESDLIDKFLGLKELRIVAESEERSEERSEDQGDEDNDEQGYNKSAAQQKQGWQEVEINELHNFEDDASSEELAAIYLSQGLFDEAKEIYNRLFLLYSEKSVYFARQIEKIEENERNNN